MMVPSDLEPRFLAPKGWTDHYFTNDATNHKIRYGFVLPEDAPVKAIVVALPGLSEFCEKYFETAHDMLARGYGFFCLDWHYQGQSGRWANFPQRRHSDGFDTDLKDLDLWIKSHVIPRVQNTDGTLPPMLMLAHSMGGMIGLRYLSEYSGTFNAAALSAPFLGIHKLTKVEKIASLVFRAFPKMLDNYVPQGCDWYEGKRIGDGSQNLTSDVRRDKIHGAWSAANETLRLGDPTFGWIGESLKSFKTLRAPGYLEKIEIPVLFGLASIDTVVENTEIHRAASRIQNGHLIEIPGAKHEILMETDDRRMRFLAGFDKMVNDYNIVP
jgi:lysophospholipase